MSAGHTELLPCPFCGSDELSHGWSAPGVDGSATTGEVQCHNCNAVIWTDTESDAITAWNTRAIEAAEADLLGRALEALRMAAPLLAEAREALCGRDDVCTTSDGDDALLPLRDAINFILSQAREVK